jgi:hypothetical protein
MDIEALINHAYSLLQDDDDLQADARNGAGSGNTLTGSIMSMTLKAPRQYTEQAVAEALKRIGRERKRSRK